MKLAYFFIADRRTVKSILKELVYNYNNKLNLEIYKLLPPNRKLVEIIELFYYYILHL